MDCIGIFFLGKEIDSGFSGDNIAVRLMSAASYLLRNTFNCEENIVVWSSAYTRGLHKVCMSNGQRLYPMEDGFVQLVDFDVDLVRPIALVLDAKGIYWPASDLEELLNHYEFDTVL